jgi:hypothetical protein
VSPFVVRETTREDVPGILRLFAKAYGKEMPEEEWTWKFERNPDGWFGIVAVAGGEVVGNFAGWPMRFLVEGESRLVYSAGDVATDRSARALGRVHNIYAAMAGAFYETVKAEGVPFTFGFPHARALEISNRLGGTRTYFPIREVRVPCESFPSPPSEFESSDSVGETFDSLWESAARRLSDAPVRDRARANWRFHARPTRYYRMVRTRDALGECGWAVLSVTGENALVVDFLARDGDPEVLWSVFAAAAAEARGMKASRLVFWEALGGYAKSVLDRLPGERAEAGFSLIGRVFEEQALSSFLRRGHIPPAIYDVV